MELLIPALIVAGVGLLAGIVLAVGAKVFAVEVDERVEQVRDLLPGANCGGCGFSGCDGYAQAVAQGADTALCTAGGAETAQKIAELMGVDGGGFVRKVAVVRCLGTQECEKQKYDYAGLPSCAAAAMLDNGPGACRFGCLGLGDCAAVCERDAISVSEGVAAVDPSLCGACGQCAKVCPHELIAVLPEKTNAVFCRNGEKGAATRARCTAGCIGCGRCVKACEAGAIRVENFLAQIDPAKCTGCGKCVEVCVVKAIRPVG